MGNRAILIYLVISLWFASTPGCRLYRMEQKLSPEYKEFLSQVRYIVTKEERKIYLELPDSEKMEFQNEFWIRRDPDPSTKENEFKDEYFRRIEDANQMFHGSLPGWIQDRGRIYVLFGPPSERHTYPTGAIPREVWYYGGFPVIFVDRMGTGDYRLESPDAMHYLEMYKAQKASQDMSGPTEKFFDFNVKTRITEQKQAVIILEIDYLDIWFTGVENRLDTIIELSVDVRDAEKKIVLSETKEYPISILENEIGKGDKITIEYLLALERGVYLLNLHVLNRAGKETRKKSLQIELKRPVN